MNDVREYGAGRKVSIARDKDQFVIAFQPENFVIFRGSDLEAVRKVCRVLQWNVVADVSTSL